jgi:hypothetical protein
MKKFNVTIVKTSEKGGDSCSFVISAEADSRMKAEAAAIKKFAGHNFEKWGGWGPDKLIDCDNDVHYSVNAAKTNEVA